MKSKRKRPPARRRSRSAARNPSRPPSCAPTYATTSSIAVARAKPGAGRGQRGEAVDRSTHPREPPSRAAEPRPHEHLVEQVEAHGAKPRTRPVPAVPTGPRPHVEMTPRVEPRRRDEPRGAHEPAPDPPG